MQLITSFLGRENGETLDDELFQGKDKTALRRTLLDFYIDRLRQFNYVNSLKSDEHVVKNRKNRQIYSLIFASKHPLGVEFWNETLQEVKTLQPRLL